MIFIHRKENVIDEQQEKQLNRDGYSQQFGQMCGILKLKSVYFLDKCQIPKKKKKLPYIHKGVCYTYIRKYGTAALGSFLLVYMK